MQPWPGARSFVARVVAVAALALASVVALSTSALAAPANPFHPVAVISGATYVRSDGARFAWATNSWGMEHGVVRVFDTLRGRSFRLEAPRSECSFGSIGGGLAVWSCVAPRTMLLTNLSTGRSRKPVGIDEAEQKFPAYFYCLPFSIGRHWLGFHCGTGFGPGDDPIYLNHRTGRLTDYFDPFSPDTPFTDPDYAGLFRPYCAPLADEEYPPPFPDYAPPFALQWSPGAAPRQATLQLRRCGSERAETLSQCLLGDCRTPQLGSRYVTWGEHKRAYAYLPSIRRRVLVGKAPAGFLHGHTKLSVAHTCNRVFGLWGFTIYAARFEPARGAPPCQTRGQSGTARASLEASGLRG